MSLLPDSVNWDLALEKNKETKTTEPERPKSFLSQLFNSSKKTKVPWFALGMALADAKETSLLKNKQKRDEQLLQKKILEELEELKKRK